jgi:lysophospholipase L1-like esterase
MKLLLLTVLAGLGLACQSAPEPVTSTPPNPNARTYLALGDSYTIGESVPEADRWSVQLARMLQERGAEIALPDITARTGWTTAELQEAIAKNLTNQRYDLVSLLIGVNNQYRGQSRDRYRKEFAELLKTSTDLAKGRADRVFVLSIPDWGVTPFGTSRNEQRIAEEINAFNAVAVEECRKAGVTFIDITPVSRTAKGDASLVATDDLHFSGKMYRLWAEKALPVVEGMLKK